VPITALTPSFKPMVGLGIPIHTRVLESQGVVLKD
jgi:hypothetical protein